MGDLNLFIVHTHKNLTQQLSTLQLFGTEIAWSLTYVVVVRHDITSLLENYYKFDKFVVVAMTLLAS